MTASQIEFPISVAVCAWCHPQELGTVPGTLSHGICLKHLRRLKLQARGINLARRRRIRNTDPTQHLPL